MANPFSRKEYDGGGVDAFLFGLARKESSGNPKALGPIIKSGPYKGDRAYGRYQVMGKNVPQWTKQYLGVAMTPQEFLKDEKAQDMLMKSRATQLFSKFGNWGDVASVHFSGQPVSKARTAKDQLGTTVPQYVRDVLSFMRIPRAEASTLPAKEEGPLFKVTPSSTSRLGSTANSTPSTVTPQEVRFSPTNLAVAAYKSGAKAQEDFEQRVADKLGVDRRIVGAATLGLSAPRSLATKISEVPTAAQKLFTAIRGTPSVEGVAGVKGIKSMRADLEDAYSAERAVRAARGSALAAEGGEAGAKKAMASLGGELAEKPRFTGVRPLLSQTDVDDLFDQIQAHSNTDFYEKTTARSGLWKLFNGEVPPTSQLSVLEDIFGPELVEAIRTKRTGWEKFKEATTDLLNVPRSLITSIDMSAPLRQGVLFTLTKPKQSIPAFGEMFADFFSKKHFDQWLLDIPNNPKYQAMKDSGLYIANPNKISGGLGAREEAFMSNLAEKIPLWGHVVKASTRAYVGYLNKLRVDVFTTLATKFEKEGVANPETLKSLANFVNAGTGRGDLGAFNRVAEQLNTALFSPRLIASRINLLNPIWYAKQTAPVRKEAVKSFAEFIGVGSAILAIAAGAGAEVELNSKSTDFGKIKVGDTRWDIWGGFQQWVRVFTQLATGERKTADGDIVELSKDEFPFTSRLDVGIQFGRGKLAPIPGLITELLDGQKLFGEDITLTGEIAENTIPLYLQDMDEAIAEFGPEAIFTVGVPAFFGVGTQTYTPQSNGNPFNR